MGRKETRLEEIRRLIGYWYPAEASKYMNFAQLQRTQKRLLLIAQESRESRNEVIDALLKTLEEANVRAFHGYRLLCYLVCDGLGKLQAIRAIDTPVELLDVDDEIGGSAVENRQIVLALIRIGKPAVGKLTAVLIDPDSSPKTRMRAAEALVGIGGTTATKALNLALDTEKDEAVRRYITFIMQER